MATIIINKISKESEKAICMNCAVRWNAGAEKAKDIWSPKSVVKEVGNIYANVADWFLAKVSASNAFCGYEMEFDRPVNC